MRISYVSGQRKSTTSVCNSAGFINLDPPALLMNGLCVFLRLFWQVLFSSQPSRFISRQFTPYISSKAFLILLLIVCSCKGCLEELKELKVMLLRYAYQLRMIIIMMAIFHALDLSLPDHCMFWAACNLAYLPSGILLVFHLLSIWDIAVDSDASPSCLRIGIKASKTDPFRKGYTYEMA